MDVYRIYGYIWCMQFFMKVQPGVGNAVWASASLEAWLLESLGSWWTWAKGNQYQVCLLSKSACVMASWCKKLRLCAVSFKGIDCQLLSYLHPSESYEHIWTSNRLSNPVDRMQRVRTGDPKRGTVWAKALIFSAVYFGFVVHLDDLDRCLESGPLEKLWGLGLEATYEPIIFWQRAHAASFVVQLQENNISTRRTYTSQYFTINVSARSLFNILQTSAIPSPEAMLGQSMLQHTRFPRALITVCLGLSLVTLKKGSLSELHLYIQKHAKVFDPEKALAKVVQKELSANDAGSPNGSRTKSCEETTKTSRQMRWKGTGKLRLSRNTSMC